MSGTYTAANFKRFVLAGDKTAYLVTDLIVTAVTVMKLNSVILGKYLSCSK
jgi:hypothetical protein